MDSLSSLTGFGYWLELLIKSSLILAPALGAACLLKNQSSTVRHILLSLALIGLILLPLIGHFATLWETNLLPSPNRNQIQPNYLDPDRGTRSTSLLDAHTLFQTKTTVDTSQNSTAAKGETPLFFQDNPLLKNALLIIWLAGIGYLLMRIVTGLLGAKKLTRGGILMENHRWRCLLSIFYTRNSFKRKISLVKNHKVNTPMTYGVVKPVILMPTVSENWPLNQCSSILFHELYHIKRGDFLVKLLGWISCAFFWFNPLVWMAFKKLKIEQEKACDEMVLRSGIKPSTYATCLLKIKKSLDHDRQPAAAIGVAVNSEIKHRVLSILKKHLNLKEISMKTKILLFIFIFMLVTLVGSANLYTKTGPSCTLSETAQSTTLSQTQTQEETKKKQKKDTRTEKKQVVIHILTTDKDKNHKQIYLTTDKSKIQDLKMILKKGNGFYKIDKDAVIEIIKDEQGKKLVLHKKGKKGDEKILIKGDVMILSTDKDGQSFSIFSTDDKKLPKNIWTTAKKGTFRLKSDGVILYKGKKEGKVLGFIFTGKGEKIHIKEFKDGKKIILKDGKPFKADERLLKGKDGQWIHVTTSKNPKTIWIKKKAKPIDRELIEEVEAINETLKEMERENKNLEQSIDTLKDSIDKIKNKKTREKIKSNLRKLIKELEDKKKQTAKAVEKAARILIKEKREKDRDNGSETEVETDTGKDNEQLTWVEFSGSPNAQARGGFQIRYQGIYDKNQLENLKEAISKLTRQVSKDCKITLKTKDDNTYLIEVVYKSDKTDEKKMEEDRKKIEKFLSELNKKMDRD